MPLSEEFARWREDPMTRTVLSALEAAEAEQKKQWDSASWGGGLARGQDLERLLLELRVRADAYRSLHEMTFADVAAWLGIENAE